MDRRQPDGPASTLERRGPHAGHDAPTRHAGSRPRLRYGAHVDLLRPRVRRGGLGDRSLGRPTENWQRIQEAGVADRVHPIQSDAHKLPFSHGFFDAIVSVGAFNYFATGADYLAYCIQFLRPGGAVGVIVPGIRTAPDLTPPPYLATRWGPDLCTWLPPNWWRQLWERTNLVTVETADFVPDGWADWLLWLKTCAQVGRGYEPDEQMLEADQGDLLGLTRVVAHLN